MSKKPSPKIEQADVVIAGLGPTGLVLSHMLGMRGHNVVVLEREPVFYGNARAVYTDDECMRVFQHIGCAAEIQKKMLQETPVQFVRPDGSVMGQYFPRKRPFGWPVVNFFYQPYLETTLTELLDRYPNVKILRGREALDFVQDSDGVTVTHQATQQYRFSDNNDAKANGDGNLDKQTVRASYFVGADGGRSFVREKLGIKMTGKSFPEPWLVVDLKLKEGADALRHLPYFNFVVDPGQPVVSCIQPDGFHRFEFMLKPGQTKEYMEQPETVRMYLSRFVDPDKFEVMRKLVYTFNALIVERWRERRVLLAGDAAHMTPQFMGQGASAGIRDAFNLGWKLSAVLNGEAGDKLLDSYGSERHDHAKSMIDISVQLKNVVSMTSPVGTRMRDAIIKYAQMIPPLKTWFVEGGFKPRPVYTRGQYLGLPRHGLRGPEGAMAPQPDVRLIDGRRMLLDDLLGNGFSLVGLSNDPRLTLSAKNRRWLDSIHAHYVSLYPYAQRPQGLSGVERATPSGLSEAEDMDGRMIRWFARAGFATDAVAILRPDRFTFAVVSRDDLDKAVDELRQQMGVHEVAVLHYGKQQNQSFRPVHH
uniref:Monooxygenase FAD-binding protein n=1 Tax=uncultured bacterium UPO53 TaxID=1776978 RepID=A0A126SYK6_9BACT|nr:monooxygenase FAD-binding protein [uncultured bacterium UPO53]